MNKLISVIIPTYNNENTIIKTLDSIYYQSFKNYEVIIVNDGSTDNSKKMIDNYILNKPNFSQFYKNNSGVSDTRNFGLSKAIGDYVTFIDSDDYVDLEYFEDFRINNQNNDLIIYGYKQHYNEDERIVTLDSISKFNNKKDVYEILSKKNLFNIVWNKFFKRKKIKDIFFDTSFDIGEDMDFVIKFLKKEDCENILFIDKAFYNYFLSLNGLGFKKRKETFIDKFWIYRNILDFYDSNIYKKEYINTILFKSYLLGFITLKENNDINKNDVYKYIDDCNRLVDFSNLSMPVKFIVINNIINLKNIFLIWIIVFLLQKFDYTIKKRKFGF